MIPDATERDLKRDAENDSIELENHLREYSSFDLKRMVLSWIRRDEHHRKRAESAERERDEILSFMQRFQPPGSPPPGNWRTLLPWIMEGSAVDRQRIETLEGLLRRAMYESIFIGSRLHGDITESLEDAK